jgi:hypothetical protein
MEYIGVIYSWTNLQNGQQYIGQTKSSSVPETRKRINTPEKLLYNRWNGHCTEANKRPKDYFHHAIRSYSSINFIGKILKTFYANTLDEVRMWTDREEQESIKEHNCICPHGYNLQTGGDSPVFHEETKKKMRIKKQKFLNSEKGEEWKKQLSERQSNHFQSEVGKEQAKKHSEYIVRLYEENPSIKNAISNTLMEYFKTDAGKAQIEKQKQSMKDFFESEEGNQYKNNLREHAIVRWTNPDYLANQVAKGKERFEGKEGEKRRKRLSELAKERNNDTKRKKQQSDAAKAHFDKIGRKVYKCEVCDKPCRNKTEFDKHCNTKVHKKRAEGYSAEEAEKIRREEAGKKRSETCKTIGPIPSSRKGIPSSEDSKEKNRQAHLGKTLSDESKQKLSETIKKQYESGERRSGLAKLTDDQVRFIRKNRGIVKQAELAKQFNVAVTTISAIQRDKVYTHVKPDMEQI